MATYVTGKMVEDGSVTTNDLQAAAVTTEKLALSSVTAEKLAPNAAIPAGAVMSFAMSAAPVGWLPCDGAAINRTTYSALFNVVGTIHGIGDGSNTFNVPDLRGEFIRGWSAGRAVDSGRTFGTFQEGTYIRTIPQEWFGNDGTTTAVGFGIGIPFANADEVYANSLNQGFAGGSLPGARTATNGAWSAGFDDNVMIAGQLSQGQGVNDTSIKWIKHRPRNVALLYCIKF